LATKKKSAYDYTKLRRKIFLRGLVITACAAGAVLLFRTLTVGRLADALVSLMQKIFNMEYFSAYALYNRLISRNIETMMILCVIVFMLLLFGMLLRSFTKYFDEVVGGIDKIMVQEKGEISLSPELEFVQDKLNNVKETLAKRAEDARISEQQKDDLVVYLAHDIKTPLTSVIGYLSLLDETKDLTSEQRDKYSRIALEKANRLEVLVDEFFEITRNNLQSVQLNTQVIDLGVMMLQISDELYPQLAACEKEITIDIADDITVLGDADKLARVFNNILKNAIAYSKEKSRIAIAARMKSGKTQITFKSKGAIPEDKLEAIFDKFNRLNCARSTQTGGAGLGLAIAKDIVLAHGGEIFARSDGEYSVFVVSLRASS